jgi:hypothetical protein
MASTGAISAEVGNLRRKDALNSYNGFTPAQRNRAQAWLRHQWADGSLPRPTVCCACGQPEGIIDAHAESYAEPFGPHLMQYPLCFRCHMHLHCRFRHPEAWDRYRAAVRCGVRFAAIYSRAFGVIEHQLLGGAVAFTVHDPPTAFPLDEIHQSTRPQGAS